MKETLLQPLVASGGVIRVKRARPFAHDLDHSAAGTRRPPAPFARPRADKGRLQVLSAGDSRQAVHLYLMHDCRLLLVSARQRVLDASIAV